MKQHLNMLGFWWRVIVHSVKINSSGLPNDLFWAKEWHCKVWVLWNTTEIEVVTLGHKVNWRPLKLCAPNRFWELSHWHLSLCKHSLTVTFSYVNAVSLSPFLMWIQSHCHLYLNQNCLTGTFPYVTDIHTYIQTPMQLQTDKTFLNHQMSWGQFTVLLDPHLQCYVVHGWCRHS